MVESCARVTPSRSSGPLRVSAFSQARPVFQMPFTLAHELIAHLVAYPPFWLIATAFFEKHLGSTILSMPLSSRRRISFLMLPRRPLYSFSGYRCWHEFAYQNLHDFFYPSLVQYVAMSKDACILEGHFARSRLESRLKLAEARLG